ncbi:MAG TPA: molybdenum cofactor biosynthesis protein MoaE [Patescibacteria group bacterium]|nr:molybdenum cofactor biosynthesis protein MoaE [Patescibacteria group bacterium]
MNSVRVKVLFFGRLREIVGAGSDDAEVDAGARVSDLFDRYGGRFPLLADMKGSIAPSVNQEFAIWEAVLSPGDEVAFLPPVSGGSGAMAGAGSETCELVRRPLAPGEWLGSLAGAADGAMVVFEGRARNHSRGRRVLRLEYEAYEPMAMKKMRQLAAALRTRFGVSRVVIVHRLGRIEIGETSIVIGVSSAHRQASFDACRHGIDDFKRTVPIWKKEFFEDDSAWAEGERPEVVAR